MPERAQLQVSGSVELYQQDLQRAGHERDENECREHGLIEHPVFCDLLRHSFKEQE